MQNENKARVTIRVGGREYTLVGQDAPERIQRVAAYVDRKMQEIGLATRTDAHQQAVLTALNIAQDLMNAQDDNSRLRRELEALRAKREE